MDRLSKVLAQNNVASRRKSEELIKSGVVSVNGQVITDLSFKVAKDDEIKVEGKQLHSSGFVYFLLNKPSGYLTTNSDDKNRKTIFDLFNKEDLEARIYPIGRLDFDAQGLILLTNDGELTKKLTSPKSFQFECEYVIRLSGIVIKDVIRKLRSGYRFSDGTKIFIRSIRIIEMDKVNKSTLINLVTTEHRIKDIKQMFLELSFKVKGISRIRFDSLTLDGVSKGSYRKLKIHEIKQLHRLTSGENT